MRTNRARPDAGPQAVWVGLSCDRRQLATARGIVQPARNERDDPVDTFRETIDRVAPGVVREVEVGWEWAEEMVAGAAADGDGQ